MVNLKGTGAPDSSIQASIGDIYTDDSTGKRYKCTFAYRSGGDKFDTQWTEVKGDANEPVEPWPEPIKEEVVVEPSPEVIKEDVKAETPVEPIEDVAKEEAPTQDQKKPKNYANYSKAKNKQTAK